MTLGNRYNKLVEALASTGTGTMKCHGNSMLPILANPSICQYRRQKDYTIGDIVFCRVRGRYIDAHLVFAVDTSKQLRRYLIGNNRGGLNGWTTHVFGRVVHATNEQGRNIYHAY